MKLLLVLSGVMGLVLSEAPYQPSGWKPSGALLVLPSRQQNSNTLHTANTHQQQTFSRVQLSRQQTLHTSYGPPQTNNTQQQDKGAEGSSNDATAQQVQGAQAGAYYVLLPDGRLQKIQYSAAKLTDQAVTKGEGTSFQSASTGQQFQSRNSHEFTGVQDSAQNHFATQNFQQSFDSGKFSQPQDSQRFGQATNAVNSFQRFEGNSQTQQTSFHTQQNASNQQKSATDASQTGKESRNEKDNKTPPALVAQFGAAQLKANGPFPDGYVASIQYSDVPPITAPVYVYNTEPLVRVLRMTL